MLPRLGLLLVLLASCEKPATTHYLGEPGRAVPITLVKWLPVLEVGLAEHGERLPVLLDTGSPLTAFNAAALPTAAQGATPMTLEAFQLTFPDWQAVVMELFAADSPCSELRPAGVLGGDLLRNFRLGLDYQGQRALLFDGPRDDPARGTAIEAPMVVPLALEGGGTVQLSNPVTVTKVHVPATRLVVDALVEGQPATAIIDTGASLTVASQQLLDRLEANGRPQLCCHSVSTAYGETQGLISRLKEVRLGAAAVANLPVVVLEGTNFFTGLSAETKREISLLIGGSFLRYFAVDVDYPEEQLTLSRYQQPSHVDPAEYVGAGFVFCKARQSADGMIVTDVYRESEAARQGVVSGAHLLAVDGQSVTSRTAEEVRNLIRTRPLGATVSLTFRDKAPIELPVERMLPDFQ